MGLLCDAATRRCEAQRFIGRLHHPEADSSERMADGRRLAGYITTRRHLFAAVLTVMTVPHALHRLAALHCLLRGCHRSTVERITDECDRQHRRKD